MQAGKRKRWEKRRIRLTLDASNARDDVTLGIGGLAAVECAWTPTKTDLNLGIRLACSTQLAGSGPITTSDHRYRLYVQGLYDFTEVRAGWLSPLSTHIIFNELRLYGDSSEQVNVRWDSIEWYIEGVLFHTVGAGSFFSNEVTYCGIPIVGKPPEYSSASFNDIAIPI